MSDFYFKRNIEKTGRGNAYKREKIFFSFFLILSQLVTSVVLNRRGFYPPLPPQGTLGNVWRRFWLSRLGGLQSSSGESPGTVQHLTIPRTAHHQELLSTRCHWCRDSETTSYTHITLSRKVEAFHHKDICQGEKLYHCFSFM